MATVDDGEATGTDHFTYTGGSWTACGGCQADEYQGSFRYASNPGDEVTLSFTGTQATLSGYVEPAGGIASVSVDGGAPTDVNLYAAKAARSTLFTTPVLPTGAHTVVFAVSGRTSGSSSTVNIDSATVMDVGPPATGATATDVGSPATGATGSSSGTTSSTGSSPTSSPPAAAGAWLSGESANTNGVDGSFANWRGRSVEIGGTWGADDTWGNMEASPYWTVGPDGAWADTPRMDYAMNAFPKEANSSQNWSAAASGAYDAHWTTIIRNLKDAWGSRPASSMYIRFAHEMNGNWYNHSVPPDQVANFKAAWVRIFDIVRAEFPGANLVWSVNHDNSWNYSETDLYPGDAYVDVVSMDSYNNYPWCNSVASCEEKFNATQNGGPAGLETLRQFAEAHGKPFAVSEWANAAVDADGGGGDAPTFLQYMHDWLTAHAGTGPGQVVYEVLFNTPGFQDHYEIFENGQPSGYETQTASLYAQLW